MTLHRPGLHRLIPGLILGLALGLTAAPAAEAAPRRYLLDDAASSVAFEADFGQGKITGRMPVGDAEILLDIDHPNASSIRVALDVEHAQTDIPFAGEAMRGRLVLDTAAHPRITFASTAFRTTGTHADVDGILTIRGIARPVTLAAEFYRRAGTEPGDLSSLAIHIRLAVNRSDFGATGYAELVGDEVRVLILARIDRAE